MRVIVVVGVRPQYIKLAPLMAQLSRHHSIFVVDTGQHYDPLLSAAIRDDIGADAPDVQLTAATASRLQRLSTTIQQLADVFETTQHDLVIAIGDSDPAYAAAIAASAQGSQLMHVEAGLRSSDPELPEQRNRRCIDALADLNCAPTPNCLVHLAQEGIANASFVGDLHLDAVLAAREGAPKELHKAYGLAEGEYILATIHRKRNLASLSRLTSIVGELVATPHNVLLPLHPGTYQALRTFDLLTELEAAPNIVSTKPLRHSEILGLLAGSRAVVTDSGGLQREAYFLGRYCIVCREDTEFPETLLDNGGHLVDADGQALRHALKSAEIPPHVEPRLELFGQGAAAQRIAAYIEAESSNILR